MSADPQTRAERAQTCTPMFGVGEGIAKTISLPAHLPSSWHLHQTILSHLRLTLLEAVRTRLLGSVAAAAAAGLGIALLVGQIAITDSRRMQAAIGAALLRLAAVAIVGVFVIASHLRAVEDKALEMLIALPAPRAAYYVGRLAGFAGAAVLVAVALSLVLLPFADAGAVALWGVSLAFELALVAAAALFFAGAIASITGAVMVLAGLYLLGRAIAALRLIGGSAVLGGEVSARGVRGALA